MNPPNGPAKRKGEDVGDEKQAPTMPEKGATLEAAFRDVIRSAESRFGLLIPPDFEELCRLAFFTGAIEAVALIECDGVTPKEIVAEYRAQFGSDTIDAGTEAR